MSTAVDVIFEHVEYHDAIYIRSDMQSVFDYFRNNQSKNFLPVVSEEQAPIGVIRERDLKQFAYSMYGTDIIRKKEVGHFLSQCFVIDVDISINDLIDTFSTKGNNDGFVLLTKETRYIGILNARALLKGIKEKIKRLTKEITQSNRSIADVREFISDVVKLINFQSRIINDSSIIVEKNSKYIQDITRKSEEKLPLIKKLEEVSRSSEMELSNSTNLIKKVADSAHVILEMVAVINNIAKKTNVLSINAAIEAARAGKVGNGFRIVADEIRKLSSEVGKNSTRISDSLEEIISNIHVSKDSTIRTGELVLHTLGYTKEAIQNMVDLNSSMQQIFDGNKEIINSFASLNEVSVEVKHSADGIDKKMEVIIKNMKNVAFISQEVEGATNKNLELA